MNRLAELLRFARANSPFYAELYKNVSPDCEDLSLYPIVDQPAFWAANANFGKGVLTAPHENGLVFKSGGTSGNPKFSYFTAHEWDSFTVVSGRGFRRNGVQAGDRIANLFYAGELYASFLYVSDLIKSADIGVCYPIGGHTPVATMVSMLHGLRINVIAGVPTTIMNLVAYLRNHPEQRPDIDLILFGGETFYDDQLTAVHDCFGDKLRVHSLLYASVDGGELGYFDAASCENGEHRCFDESTIMEIVDEESGEVINEMDRAGRLLVTNLNRRLMPLIRYPVGDRVVWREPENTPDRKFKLQGRSQEGARVGPATLYVQDVLKVLEHFRDKVKILNFQIVLSHDRQKDRAVIRAVPRETPHDPQRLAREIIEHLYRERSLLEDLIRGNKIHPITLEWCTPAELESNARTGKTKHIIDHRLGNT
jgi:phenylacetate-CoA ligase